MKRKEFFDHHAENWDSYSKEETASKISFLIDMMHIKKGMCVLDVGCGTGILLPFLKNQTGEKGRVLAFDISLNMLLRAKEKHQKDFTYVQGDAERSPFKENLFDSIICFSCFPHFPEKEKALKSLYSTLKTNRDLFVVHSESRETINTFHRGINGVVKHDRIPEENIMHELFSNAGFSHIHIHEGKQYYFATGKKSQ